MTVGKFISGKADLIGRSIVYPLPITLAPAPYIGSLVAAGDADVGVNIYFSDGVSWRQHIAMSAVLEQITVLISEIKLQGYAEADLPNPALAVNELRLAFNETKGAPGYVWDDEWKYLVDEARATAIAVAVSQAGTVPQFFAPGLEFTVGTGVDDYATINAAISAALLFTNNNIQALPPARILIKSGFVVTDQLALGGSNLDWLQIDAEDDWVDVNVSTFSTNSGRADAALFAFIQLSGGTMPVINCGFSRVGTLAAAGTTIGVECRAASMRTLITPALKPRGVRGFHDGTVLGAGNQARLLDWTSIEATRDGLRCEGGAFTNLLAACRIYGATRSIYALGLAQVLIRDAACNVRRADDVARPTDVVVGDNSTIHVYDSISLESLSQAPNILNSRGFIAKNNEANAYGQGIVIADDAVATIVPPRLGGFLLVTVQNGTTFIVAAGGIVGYSCGASLSASELSFAGHGANLVATTGTLAGTTGTDGNVTVSARAADIQIENRLGGARTFYVSWM